MPAFNLFKVRFEMDQEQKQSVSELAALLHENNLSEIEYEANGVHIRVCAFGAGAASVPQTLVPVPAVQPAAEVSGAVPGETKPAGQMITSPMVGVVYLSKDPGTPPFVQVGDHVSVGQTVCLVEAMKTFNPIKSTQAGTITEILVDSGSPVEFDQPLFRVA